MANVSRYRDRRAAYRHYHACLDAVRVELDAGTWHLVGLVSYTPTSPNAEQSPAEQLAAARRLTSGYLRHGHVKHARDLVRAAR